jgi:peptide/nickel transport system substrate-binding protein
MRKFYWYLTAYVKKHGLTVAITVVAAVVIFSFLMPFLAKKISVKNRQYVGMVGDFNLNFLPKEIKQKLSVGLTTVDPEDQSIKPLLAERWVTENDGKTYRFTLKKGVKWQDGQELTPDDINYNLQDVETISTPNDIIFKLPDTFAPFPALTTEPIFKQTLERYLIFFKKPNLIGIGPYKISSYEMKNNSLRQITLESPDEILVYRFYLTEQDAIIGFKKGEVDLLLDVRQPGDLADWSDNTVLIEEKINFDQYLAVFFNHNDPLITKNVKQALAYATEKPSSDIKAVGPINPKSWAFLEGGKDYSKDLDRAVERLISDPPEQSLEFSLTTTVLYLDQANHIKQQWQEFGELAVQKCQNSDEVEDKNLCSNMNIELHIKVTNFPDLQDYQLLLIGQEIPVDPDQYFLWHSEQPSNFTNYQNTRIDSILENARQALEYNDRLALYQEFQQFLLEDPPAIFLQHLISYDVRR